MVPMRTRRTISIILLALTAGAAFTACVGAPGVPDTFSHVLSEGQLAKLRACESGGNYNACLLYTSDAADDSALV